MAADRAAGKAQKNTVSVAIGAGQEATVNATDLGLPRYGLESLEVGLQSVSGVDLSDAISVAPGGAVESQTVTPTETPTGDVVASTETGIAGNLVLTNDSTESVTLELSVVDWEMADRVIPASQEPDFIAAAVRMGTPTWMAEMAVYDRQLAESTAVSSSIHNAKRLRQPALARDAADGTCGGGYRITGWGTTADYTNWEGSRLWSVSFNKRFCFNPTQRIVGSTYWNLGDPLFSALGNASWVHVSKSAEISRYDGWGGKAQGSHVSKQTHVLKHCSVKWVICGGDQAYDYKVIGYGDGSKVPSWS